MSDELYHQLLNSLVGVWAQVFNFTTMLLSGGTWSASDKVDDNDMHSSEVGVFYESLTLLQVQLLTQIEKLPPDDYGDIKSGLETMQDNWQLTPGEKDFHPLLIISLCRASMDTIDDISNILQTLSKGNSNG